VRVDVSADAGEFVRGRGGRLWVWAAHPRVCCAPAGRMPDALEIGVHGRRHPRVEAYWDGCSFAL
jgi:hypothetical protein